MEDLVSVIIPTYNRKDLLKRALNSVLNQTYENMEILVIDDASSEDIESVIKEFEDNRIRYIQHSNNRGAPAARNTGIKKSTGEYIAFLDSDDQWMPAKIEIQMEAMKQSSSDTGVIYCSNYSKYEETSCLREPKLDIREGNIYQDLLSGWMGILTSMILVDSDCFESVGYFDIDLPSFQEYDLLVRMSKKYNVRHVPHRLVISHTGDFEQISTNHSKRLAGLNSFTSKHQKALIETNGKGGVEKFRMTRLPYIYQLKSLENIQNKSVLKSITSIYTWHRIRSGLRLRHYVLIFIVALGGQRGRSFVQKLWFLYLCSRNDTL